MFLLDTSVLSDLRRRDRANPDVLSWASAQIRSALFISAVTVLEFDRGCLLVARRDPAQADVLRDWIERGILPEFATRILPVDTAVARRTAALHVPDPRPERDAFIAATALVHGLTVVTRNAADFAPMGVPVLNPWEAQA